MFDEYTFTGATIMVTLLATKIGLEEALWALRMTFPSCKLPSSGTSHTLVSTRAQTRCTTEIALVAFSSVTVVTGNKIVHNPSHTRKETK